MLTVTVEGRDVLNYEWVPARLHRGIPHPLEGAEAAQALKAWHELRGCTDLAS